MNRIDAVHPATPRRDLPPFRTGDTVRVHVNITEGDKQRIQVFEGVVLRRRGHGPSSTFTVRKVSYGVGVERVFPTQSPNVTKVEIKSRGHVRQSRTSPGSSPRRRPSAAPAGRRRRWPRSPRRRGRRWTWRRR
jgi:large subunit ribosomal protein L19